MPDIVEVRLQIHVYDTGLVLHNRLRHAQDGVMGRAFWAIAVRTRLEVRFKDRLQDELEGSLNHTITDGRDREEAATFAALLRDRLVPQPHGAIRAGDQFVPYLLQKRVEPAGLNGFKGHAVNSRRAVIGLGQLVFFLQYFRVPRDLHSFPTRRSFDPE